MELNMKKVFDPKSNIGVWSLENSFWQFRHESLIKPQVQNPSSNFHKEDFTLSRIIQLKLNKITKS